MIVIILWMLWLWCYEEGWEKGQKGTYKRGWKTLQRHYVRCGAVGTRAGNAAKWPRANKIHSSQAHKKIKLYLASLVVSFSVMMMMI